MSDSIKVLVYARVSTVEQAKQDLSIPAQLKAIKAYAQQKGLEIVREYIDEGASAYNEKKRINFDAMIEHAKDDREIRQILVHDASRFYRNKHKSSAIKGELQKYGVTVISVSSPYDPTTIDGVLLDSVNDALAQTTSMQIGFHVFKGMTENVTKRDPETGYCYKNGGVAPYGYRLKGVWLGNEQRKDNYKLLWEIDAGTSAILRKMIVDWRIGEGLSFSQIRDRLNELKIPNPSGKLWINSSISKMFREDRLMQYVGYGYWNRTVKQGTIGKTQKDKGEWVIIENAHPAIITKEEAESALAVSASRKPRTAAVSSYNSQWALTGHNLEGKPFFTCKCCGGNMSGHNNPRGGRYICTNYHYRGKAACSNNRGIKRNIIESDLLSQIENVFGNPQAIETLVTDLNSKLSGELKNHDQSIKAIEKEIQKNLQEIELTFKAFSEGLDPELCRDRQEKLKLQRTELLTKLENAKKDQPKPITIDPNKARDMFNNLKQIYEHGTNEQRRNLFKTYIRRMEFDPESNQVNVVFYAPYVQEKLRKGIQSQTYIAEPYGNPQDVIRNNQHECLLLGGEFMRKICILFLTIIIISGCSIQQEPLEEDPKVVDSLANQRAFPKVMYLQGSENIKMFPDENSESKKEISDTYVIVHNVTHDNNREEWAVVEFNDGINISYYGCIRLNRLSDKQSIPSYVCNKETVSGVAIGDGIEKAIAQFGNKYEVHKSEFGLSFLFDDVSRDIVTQIDPKSYSVKAIIVNASGYKTKEGFQVGDNATKVLNFYKSKYEMNTDQLLFNGRSESIFDLGDGYVIEFKYEPEELTLESLIKNIYLYNINDGDW